MLLLRDVGRGAQRLQGYLGCYCSGILAGARRGFKDTWGATALGNWQGRAEASRIPEALFSRILAERTEDFRVTGMLFLRARAR